MEPALSEATPAKFTASAQVLIVSNVQAAAKHYEQAMGFTLGKFYGEPPTFTIIRRDGMYVMLRQAETPEQVQPRTNIINGLWDMYFWVDDVDALYAEFVQRGAKIDYGLCNQPYGCREFGTQDLDGHDIGFGQTIT